MSFASDCLDYIGLCPNRLWVVQVGQCTTGEAMVQLIDPNTGATLDLSTYDIGPCGESSSSSSSSPSSSSSGSAEKHGVEIILKEWNDNLLYYCEFAEVKSCEDAKRGVVYVPYSPSFIPKPGAWLAQASVWSHGTLVKIYPFYWEVSPNLAIHERGPLTIPEVRMAMRDVCAEANFLIDSVECHKEEIIYAIRRPIEYWNEVPPPVQTFSPRNFPFRYHWMNATIGELLGIVGLWLRRNDLDYSAGGLTVMDTKKWEFYIERSNALKAEYKEFVLNKKIEINIQGGYNMIGGYWSTPYR